MLYRPISILTSVPIDDVIKFKRFLIFIKWLISGVNNNVINGIGTLVSTQIGACSTTIHKTQHPPPYPIRKERKTNETE